MTPEERTTLSTIAAQLDGDTGAGHACTYCLTRWRHAPDCPVERLDALLKAEPPQPAGQMTPDKILPTNAWGETAERVLIEQCHAWTFNPESYEAWALLRDGEAARRNGEPLLSNPGTPGTPAYAWWVQGWAKSGRDGSDSISNAVLLPRAGVEQIRGALEAAIPEISCLFRQAYHRNETEQRDPSVVSALNLLRAALAILPPPTEPGTSWPLGPPVETTSEPQPPCPMCGNPASAHTPRFDEGLGVEALVCPPSPPVMKPQPAPARTPQDEQESMEWLGTGEYDGLGSGSHP